MSGDRLDAAIEQLAEQVASGSGSLTESMKGLENSVEKTCEFIERLYDQRREMVQLLREAIDGFENPESLLDIRDWLNSAKAAVAKAERAS